MPKTFRPHPMESQSIPENRFGTRTQWRMLKHYGVPVRDRRLSTRRMKKAQQTAERLTEIGASQSLRFDQRSPYPRSAIRAYNAFMQEMFEDADRRIYGHA